MIMNLPKRQPMRLKDCDYNTPGAYFITICTKDKKNLLSEIVGTGVLDCPKNILSEYGKIANNHITAMNNFYNKLVKLICKNEDELTSTLTEKQKETFEKFKDCTSELSCITEREAFSAGFILATRIMMEVMEGLQEVEEA